LSAQSGAQACASIYLIAHSSADACGASTAGNRITDILYNANPLAFRDVVAQPLQLHFHTDSEHVRGGIYYPLEMHIVHRVSQAQLSNCPPSGCLFVTGVLIKLDEDNQVRLTAGTA
jgi:carbonic anhydrase